MIKISSDKTGTIISAIISLSIALTVSLILSSSHTAYAVGCTNWAGLADADCDGLANAWETAQFYDGPDSDPKGVSLPGANPNHKDLFVEIDAVPGMTLSSTAIQHVKDAFAQAYVWNPAGELGIKLTIKLDTTTPLPNLACW